MRHVCLACLTSLLTSAAVGDGALSWGTLEIDGETAHAQLLWQSDQVLMGFQFEPFEGAFLDAGGGAVEALGWEVHVVSHMVLSFALDPALSIPAGSSATHLITVSVPLDQGQLVLANPIFATPEGEMILLSGPGVLELEPCPADLDGDGVVGVDDMLAILAHWGSGDAGDATGDGSTDVDDVLAVIAAWGAC